MNIQLYIRGSLKPSNECPNIFDNLFRVSIFLNMNIFVENYLNIRMYLNVRYALKHTFFFKFGSFIGMDFINRI
jgi:hypothetical protein